jgi:hypothetical protein
VAGRELAPDRRDHTITVLAQQAAVGLPDPAARVIGGDLWPGTTI